jgi:tetratricopeptide (TPR) repeat protein
MGLVWGLRCNLGFAPCRDTQPRGKEAFLKAAALDPDLPAVQRSLAGQAFYTDWDWAAAEPQLQRAIESNPGDPLPRVWYAEYLQCVAGRLEDGLAEMRRILEFDPHNSTFHA